MSTIAPPANKRLTRDEAAQYLGLAKTTLAQDVVSRRLGIPYHKLGRRVVYSLTDLDLWLARRAVNRPEPMA